MFTNQEISELKDIIYEKANTRPNVIKARFVKIQGYRLSKVREFNPSLIIWIDANIEIRTDDFHTYARESPFTLYKHNFLNTAHADLRNAMNDKCMYLVKRYAYEKLQEQLDAYIEDGFIETITNKYFCSGIVLIRTSQHVEKILDSWWRDVIKWTIHDQASLSYIFWKNNLSFSLIPEGEICNSPKHWFWH
jgi:hypothetical protein